MKHPLFVEILIISSLMYFSLNWFKIYVRTKLRVKRFIRTHIAQRMDPDFDLDFTPKAKVQPTGTEITFLVSKKRCKESGAITLHYLEGFESAASGVNNIVFPNSVDSNSRILYQGNGQPVYIDRKPTL